MYVEFKNVLFNMNYIRTIDLRKNCICFYASEDKYHMLNYKNESEAKDAFEKLKNRLKGETVKLD